MNLRRRINKLRQEGRTVNVNRYSIFQFNGYYADKDIARFWVWCFLFLFTSFFVFWIALSIYNGQERSKNVELVKIENDKKAQERFDLMEAKKQYIDGCKAAGKSPGYMGDHKRMWECK